MKVFDLTEKKEPEKWFKPTEVLNSDGLWQNCDEKNVDRLSNNKFDSWRKRVKSISKVSKDLAIVIMNGDSLGLLFKGDFKL